MPSTPNRSHGQTTGYSASGEKTQSPRGKQQSSPHHRGGEYSSPQPPGRKAFSGSLATFFSKLRPSGRPERGFAFREPTDSIEDCPPPRRATVAPAVSSGTRRSRSLNKQGSDTIPADRWNAPTTLPRRSYSAGNKRVPDGSPRRRASRHTATAYLPSIEARLHSAPPEGVPKPSAMSPPLSPPPPLSLPSQHYDFPTSSPTLSRSLFLAKRELRRQRRSLKESGDFLGVTGVNPYTGELDIITPPTSSSDDAAVTTSTSSLPTNSNSNSNSNTTSNNSRLTARGEARRRARLAKEERKRQREEEKLSRAEQRKEVVREVVQQQGVRWRKEEGGWSSVAEPKLSPIPGSSRGSGKEEMASGSSDAATVHRTPVGGGANASPDRRSFLGRAGAVGVRVRAHRHLRRLRRRREKGEQVKVGVKGEGVEGEGKAQVGSVCPCKPTSTWLKIPSPSHLRRLGPCQRIVPPITEYPRTWSPGDFVDPSIPLIKLHKLSMRATLPPMPASQALKLNNLSPTDQWADSLIHSLNRLDRLSNDSDTATVLRAPSPASETTSSHRSLASRPPSAYTPTTTTTGFEPTPPSASHHHSCPSSRAASPASAAIPAASQTGIHLPLPLPPSVRRFSMATTPPRREPARSRPISCPSSIGRYRESCFGRVGSSPPRSRLRDWPSIDALALGEGRGVVETGLKGEGEEEEKEEEEEERESKVASGLIVSFMPAAVLEREKGAMSLAMEEEGEEMVSPGEKEKKTPLVQSSSTSIPPLVPKGPDNVTTSSQATQTETEAHQVEKQVEEKEKVVDEEVRKEEVVKQQAVQEEMMKREEKVVMDEVIKEVAVKEDMSLLMAAVIPSSAPTPRDSAVTLTSTDQKEETLTPPQKVEKKEQQQDKAEKEPSKAKLLEQMLPARPVDPPTPPTQLNHGRDWEMRKTMRPTKNNNSPTTLSHTSSSHTYTSTYLMAQPKLSPPLHSHTPCQPQPQPHTQSQGTNPLHHHPHQPPPPHPIHVLNPALLARGAARTAFTHHRWGLTQPSITTSGFLRGGEPPPIPATSWSSDPHGGVTAAKAKTTASGGSVQGPKGKGGEKGEGLGQNCKGEGGGEEEGKPESNSNSSSNYHSDGKKKGKKSVSFAPGTSETGGGGGGGGGGGAIGFDKRAAVRLARTVGHLVWRGVVAYWRVVKPVFEAESEVRKRVDGGKGTWEDWGMCGLAVGFVFLTVSGVVWAVRGVVWVVRVVGEVGGLLRCVLGL